MNRLAWAALALAGATGCAQWRQQVAEPNPMERNFSHPMLAGRADYYPRLAPNKAATPALGTHETDAVRRPLVASAAPTKATPARTRPQAALAPRRSAAHGENPAAHGENPAAHGENLAAHGEPTVAQTSPTGHGASDSLELESTASGLSFAGPGASSEAGLNLEAVPERPRAPKATADVGLGDPTDARDWRAAGGALEAAAESGHAPVQRALYGDEPNTTDAAKRNPRKAEGPDADQARVVVSFDPAEARHSGQDAYEPAVRAEGPSAPTDAVVAPSDTLVGHTGAVLGDGTAAAEALAAAQRLLGVRTPWDEGRFLAHLMAAADLDVRASDSTEVIKAVHDHLEAEGLVFGVGNSPERGDLVFFSNTFDRDDDGRADDWFTMVGIVEAIDGGTLTFIGVTQGEVRRMVLDLDRPSAEVTSDGTPLNSQLRAKALSDRPFTKYLAGELLVDFGRLPDDLGAR